MNDFYFWMIVLYIFIIGNSISFSCYKQYRKYQKKIVLYSLIPVWNLICLLAIVMDLDSHSRRQKRQECKTCKHRRHKLWSSPYGTNEYDCWIRKKRKNNKCKFHEDRYGL